jgi:hypothetical protein
MVKLNTQKTINRYRKQFYQNWSSNIKIGDSVKMG